MYCPNCGQPTPNDALRFCRQCGFRLDSVAQLINTGGAPLVYPQAGMAAQVPVPPLGESPRRKGFKAGAKLFLSGIVSLPLFGFFAIELVDSPFPLFIPLTLILAGIARWTYARLFDVNYPQPYQAPQPMAIQQSSVAAPLVQPQASLPPVIPNTNDLYEPPSVVEPTTSLLKQPK